MSRLPRRLRSVVRVLLLVVTVAVAQGQEPPRPLESLLNEDGTIDLSSGYDGPVDIEGWRVLIPHDGPPRFLPSSSKIDSTVDTSFVEGDQYWDSRFGPGGLDGPAYAIAVHDGWLYVGGKFSFAGNVVASNIARWDGRRWYTMGYGTSGPVYAMTLYNGRIAVAGGFRTAGTHVTRNIALWNPSSGDWDLLDSYAALSDTVYALASDGGDLYAGGRFTSASWDGGRVNAGRIARWNGTRWFTVGDGFNNIVRSIVARPGRLFAGGDFTASGSSPAIGVARFDSGAWKQVGTGLTGRVHALAYDGATLYAGGSFSLDGSPGVNVARWDGAQGWEPLGGGLDGTVNAMVMFQGELVAAGWFERSATTTVHRIARLVSGAWRPLGAGMGDNVPPVVHVLAADDSSLYAGGRFLVAGTTTAFNIARWDGELWRGLNQAPPGVDRSGTNGGVFAVAMRGSDLFVGGDFSVAGGVAARRIARWDGTTGEWHPLGSGIDGPSSFVRALAIVGDDLYVGGIFPSAGSVASPGIARWKIDEERWESAGGGVGGSTPYVFALAPHNGLLYATGAFTEAGGGAANRIARFDGTSWSPLGGGISGDTVYVYGSAIAAGQAGVVVGGTFSRVDGRDIPFVARWDGSSWYPLGAGLNGQVSALLMVGDTVIAGGEFTKAGGATARHLALWSGAGWSELAGGASGPVRALHRLATGEIIVGGDFDAIGSVAVAKIGRVEGESAAPVAEGTNGVVHALASGELGLAVAGEFSIASRLKVSNVALYDGGGFSSLGSDPSSGLEGIIRAVALFQGDVYVGGDFSAVGGVRALNIARWDGLRWSAVGPRSANGVDATVLALAADERDLFVGGAFTRAGELGARYIARWDGSDWHRLGEGVDGSSPYVFALVVRGDSLYAGGAFRFAGDGSASRVARWIRSSGRWEALGAGIGGGSYYTYVSALEFHEGDLYAGGNFTSAGETVASNIARWDGERWHNLGGYGTSGTVYTIRSHRGSLYVGGAFQRVGSLLSPFIASWDGSSWHPLANGVNAPVHDMGSFGGTLYVAGAFTGAGAFTPQGVALWNGESWGYLGRGVGRAERDGAVYALAIDSANAGVVIGGDFTVAGGTPSSYFGIWHIPDVASTPAPTRPLLATPGRLGIHPNPVRGTATIGWRLDRGGEARLQIVDSRGVLARELQLGSVASTGERNLSFDGLAAGPWFARLLVGGRAAGVTPFIIE